MLNRSSHRITTISSIHPVTMNKDISGLPVYLSSPDDAFECSTNAEIRAVESSNAAKFFVCILAAAITLSIAAAR